MKTNYLTMLLSSLMFFFITGTPNVYGSSSDSTDVTIYAFAEEPVIDGIIEAGWDDNLFLNIEKISEDLSVVFNFSEKDFLPRFKVSWYGNKLYFLFVVNDDILFNSNSEAYRNDGFSINLDLGNELNTTLDDNDHNLVAGWGKPEMGFIFSGDNNLMGANLIDVVEYAETIDETNGIFIAEIAFDVTVLNMPSVLAEGVVFGMEIEVYDFDGHDNQSTFGRDMTAYWYSDSGNSWFDRSTVGSVGLGAIELKSAKTTLNKKELTRKNEMAVYPQPAKEMITVQAGENLSRIEIYNTLGELVSIYPVNSLTSQLDVSGLKAGYYFISGYTNTGLFSTTKLVIQ